MWPWGHAAVGYLLYSAGCRARGRRPRGLPVLALLVGTQFPDVVDKPLAWTVTVLPSGRSLAHSLFAVAAVGAFGYWLARRVNRPAVAGAFSLGHLSHALSDLPPSVLTGEFTWATYLLWPLLPTPPYPHDSSFLEHVLGFSVTPFVWFQFALVGVAVVAWIRDGKPGWRRLTPRRLR